MTPNESTVRTFRFRLERITHKYTRLTAGPLDFGTGELLYPAELHTIEAVGTGIGNTVTALASCFGITKSAVSQVAGKLERRGYLKRERNADYAKEKLLSLTAKGKKVLKAHTELHVRMDASLGEAFSGLSENDVALSARFMELLEQQIDRWTASLDARNSGNVR